MDTALDYVATRALQRADLPVRHVMRERGELRVEWTYPPSPEQAAVAAILLEERD